MGCKSCLWRLIKITAACLLITFVPGLPPYNVEYKEHIVKKPQSLEGDLASNTQLNNADHIFEGQLVGPEAFAVYKGAVYTGVHGGFVIRIDSEGISPIVKFGKNCDDISEERVCGRPLGLQFDKEGNLYVVDAYYGLFKYNMKSATSTRLVDVNDVIEEKKSMFMNSLAVASDGSVYFTVSSTSFLLEDGVQALLTAGDGRLMKYDPKARTTIVLAEGLFFPNGIVLSSNEDFLLFCETTALRVMKYNLKGQKKGTIEVFADGLPGSPDNIRSDGHDGYYVSLVATADPTHPFLPQMLAPFPNIRRFLSRILALVELPFIQINRFFPNSICQKAAHAIGHFGPTRFILPKTSIILQLDSQGGIKDALVGTDGSVSHISDMVIIGENILLGSPYNNFIGRVPLPKAPYQVHVKSVRFTEEGKEDGAKASQEAKVKEAAEKAKRAAEEVREKKAAEEAKRASEEAKAKKAAEEAKAKKIAEEAKRAAEAAKAKKAADEAKRAAEEAKAKKAAEEAKRAAEEAKAKKAAEEAKRAAEEAKAKKAAEEAKRAAEEAKAKKAAEEAKRAAEEAKAKKAAEEAKRAAEEARAKKVAEDSKRAAEDAKARKAAEDAKRAAEESKRVAEEAKVKAENAKRLQDDTKSKNSAKDNKP